MQNKYAKFAEQVVVKVSAYMDSFFHRKHGRIYQLLFTISLVLLALWVRMVIAPVSAGLQYLTFFPAVALSAIVGGFGAGLLATVIGLLFATFIFTPPYYSISIEVLRNSLWSNLVFLSDGLIVTLSISAMHRYRKKFERELTESKESEKKVVGLNRELGVYVVELEKMEAQVRQLAFHDTLTGLPNRRLFYDRFGQTIAASKRSGRYNALMFLDMDNFKPLNDSHGHAVGDLLLIEAAKRLKNCVRETDTVARLGGDEFVILLNELSVDESASNSHASAVAEKILASLSSPYLLSVQNNGESETVGHHCTVSIGVLVFGSHENDVDDLIKAADAAMYKAKESGGNSIHYWHSVV